MSVKQTIRYGAIALATAGLALAGPASAQYRQKISHDPGRCNSGASVKINISGIKSSSGKIRVQSYRGTKEDWLEKGKLRPYISETWPLERYDEALGRVMRRETKGKVVLRLRKDATASMPAAAGASA